MEVHKLLFDPEATTSAAIGYELNDFDHTRLWRCEVLPSNALANTVMQVRCGETNPDLLSNPLSWLICSDRMSAFLAKRAPKHVQVLNCNFVDTSGNAIMGYKVLNVITYVSALNIEKSDCEFEAGAIDRVHSWVFDRSRVPNEDVIFRETLFPYAIFVTDRLARAFPAMTGFSFLACKTV